MVSPYPFHLSFFINLLSKVSYKTFCRKHYKEGDNFHNLKFDPLFFIIRKIKNKKNLNKGTKMQRKKNEGSKCFLVAWGPNN
jgi:hypothetical protein